MDGILPPGVYRRGNTYWVTASAKGRRLRRPAGRTLEEAVRVRTELLTELGQVPSAAPPAVSSGPTVAGVCGSYLKRLEVRAKASSVAAARSALARVTALIGDLQADALTAADVERYQATRLQEVSRVRVNSETRQLRAAVRAALPRDPLARWPMLRTTKKMPDILTREEVNQLLAVAGPLRPLLQVAALSGLRCGELAALRWQDVRAGAIRVAVREEWSPKSGRERMVPLHPVAQEVLAALERHGEHVFVNARRRPWTPTSLSRAVRKVFESAGLHDPARKPGLHQLRRTFVSALLESGADVETVRELAGHSSLAVVQAYARALDRTKRDAVGRLRL